MRRAPSLTYQIKTKLTSQLKVGESKFNAKIDQKTHAPEGIYSYSTLKSYMKHANYFAKWAKANYQVKSIENARPYVEEYLQHRIDRELSASTIKLDSSSLAKLYGCKTTDFAIVTPSRYREDITRSRNEVKHDKHFSEKNNQEIVDFCRGTGLRRHEITPLKGANLTEKNGRLYVYVENGKGGKERFATVRKEYESIVRERFDRVKSNEKVFANEEIKNRMDVHSYRREYAAGLYKERERNLSELNRSEKYYCRLDKAGVVYDRQAMLETSRDLGHNRIDVIASNYL